MKQILGVAHQGRSGAWVHLEVTDSGVQISGARSVPADGLAAVVADGVAATGCKDVSTVLWAPAAAVGSLAPDRTRGLSRRKLFNAALAIAEQHGFDPKRDDVRLVKEGDLVVFAFASAKEQKATRLAVRSGGGRLRSLQIASSALANVLPEKYEVALFSDGDVYRLLEISSGPTRMKQCETLDDVSLALFEATKSNYISGHLTPVAVLDESALALLSSRAGDPDKPRFEGRNVELYRVPQEIRGIGTVALGAGYGALANA